MSETIRVIVRGRVQGVGFRAFVQQTAQALGVAGWVRNLPGGDVEVVARVTPATRSRLLARLQQGPPMARVDDVEVSQAGPEVDIPQQRFSVRH